MGRLGFILKRINGITIFPSKENDISSRYSINGSKALSIEEWCFLAKGNIQHLKAH